MKGIIYFKWVWWCSVLSLLSGRVKRTSELLRLGAEDRVLDYERRFSSMRDLYERLLSRFIIFSFSFNRGYETALEFFGSSKVRFAVLMTPCILIPYMT